MDDKKLIIKNWLGNGSINIFGMPFSGKDTQGAILAEHFGGVMISSGDILRHDHGNQQIQQIMAEGGSYLVIYLNKLFCRFYLDQN